MAFNELSSTEKDPIQPFAEGQKLHPQINDGLFRAELRRALHKSSRRQFRTIGGDFLLCRLGPLGWLAK